MLRRFLWPATNNVDLHSSIYIFLIEIEIYNKFKAHLLSFETSWTTVAAFLNVLIVILIYSEEK